MQIHLQKQPPQKGPLKNIIHIVSPGAYFQTFTVYHCILAELI